MHRTLILGMALLAGPAVAAGQHAGHGTPAPQAPGAADAQMVTACVRSQQQAAALAAHLNRRMEAARQTNSAAAMRAAMDDLQAGLTELQAVLKACDPLQAAAGAADPHAGHTMGAAPAAAGTPAPAAAGEAIDPVCGMKADPKSAPSAEYQGKTYYFCSEGDRELFLKAPAKYVKK